jgi:hypothetical protein
VLIANIAFCSDVTRYLSKDLVKRAAPPDGCPIAVFTTAESDPKHLTDCWFVFPPWEPIYQTEQDIAHRVVENFDFVEHYQFVLKP